MKSIRIKNLLLSSFALLNANLSTSQEIKIKKGIINLDGTEVARIDKKKLIYTISDLNNTPKFSIEMKSREMLNGRTAYWCILTDINTNKTNEILDKGSYEGLSFEKSIVSSVTHGDIKLLTVKGIDEKLVTEYINGPKSTVLADFEKQDLQTISEFATEKKNLEKHNIRLEKNNIIQKQSIIDNSGNKTVVDVIVGYIERKEEVTVQNFPPSIYYAVSTSEMIVNERGKKQEIIKPIASWYKSRVGYDNPVTGKNIKEQIITLDKKSFDLPEIHPDNSASALQTAFGKPDENKLKEAIVAKLLFNGYSFGKPIE